MSRVAVIVPAHNYERFVGDALESVRAQTFTDWECIVVDDGSTDETAKVAERFAALDPRIRCIRQPNRGVSAARNAALRAASAELVQFLDADDRLEPWKLDEHVRFLDAHPETAIVFGNVVYFRTGEPQKALMSQYGKLSRPILDDRVHGAEQALQKLQHFAFLHIASALTRRADLERAGGFGETIHGAEDYDLWLKCALQGSRFDHWEDERPVAWIRIHTGSASRTRGKILRAMIAGALAFNGPRRPLLYEVSLGIHERERGMRRAGSRRILNAARNATEPLTALRWRLYGIAALLLPRFAFSALVTLPIPEQLLELYRRMRRFLR
ncbi:MAG TPA: glycosyltransferase [Thermoanaerobaculia bacterium]|nr:glycosyltransferase [Thermoanaerobaculia bacterium]